MNSFKKTLTIFTLLIVALVSVAAVNIASTPWTVDKSHSAVTFSVRHFFTPVNGKFNDYTANITFAADDLKNSSIEVTIPIDAIDTDNEKRDGHLKTADFFDAEKYPTMSFKSTKIEATGDNKFVATGKLTLKDVTKDFKLPFTLLGVMEHPGNGKLIAGITSEFTIKRNDFGVGTGDYISDAVIGNEVTVELNLELNAKK